MYNNVVKTSIYKINGKKTHFDAFKMKIKCNIVVQIYQITIRGVTEAIKDASEDNYTKIK